MQNKLAEIREARGLTQVELEKLAGWSSGTCSNLENNKVLFKTNRLEEAGRALNVSPLAIVGGEELDDDERQWLYSYRRMSKVDKERWLKMMIDLTTVDPMAPPDQRRA